VARPLDQALDAFHAGQHLFAGIGLTLAAATAVELTYTLFTHGPDEAIDPILLGLAAALLISLGNVTEFRLGQAAAAVLYVLALAGQNSLVKGETPKDWAPGLWFRLTRWLRARGEPRTPDATADSTPVDPATVASATTSSPAGDPALPTQTQPS